MERQLCQRCGLVPAVVKVEVQDEGQKVRQALCWGCVAQLSADLSLDTSRESKACGGCGWTWQDFKKHKTFGCPLCYQAFGQDLRRWFGKKGYGWQYTGEGLRG